MGKAKKTYISLFSCAGIGCYGFKLDGFECIATNELIPRRLEIQKINQKCKYDSGYICGDITLPETKQKLLDEVSFWKNKEKIDDVTVVMAHHLAKVCLLPTTRRHIMRFKEILWLSNQLN